MPFQHLLLYNLYKRLIGFRPSLLWDFTRSRLLAGYLDFETLYLSHSQGPISPRRLSEDGIIAATTYL